MSITENVERIGSFTSSEIFRLMGTPGARKTYIEEKQIERDMNRCISVDAHSQAMAWGNFLEDYVFSLDQFVGMEYRNVSQTTDVHPTIAGWSGSTDLIVPKVKIAELKCFQPKKFAQYTNALLTMDTELIKKLFPKEYYQIVSNSIIHEVPTGEAITFMPYESELKDIRAMVDAYEGGDIWKYRFIAENDKSALPYLPDNENCKFKNFNRFEFEIPQKDILALTTAVLNAVEELH